MAGSAEAFTEANRYGACYSIVVVSAGGEPVRSSTGLEFRADRAVTGAGSLNTLLVPGSDAVATRPVDPLLAAAAAELAAAADRVASVCTGAFVLAAAGLLDGRRVTTHWRHAAALQRRHARVRVEPDAIFVTDGKVVTSAGITAGIDLALALIEQDHGAALAREVAGPSWCSCSGRVASPSSRCPPAFPGRTATCSAGSSTRSPPTRPGRTRCRSWRRRPGPASGT